MWWRRFGKIKISLFGPFAEQGKLRFFLPELKQHLLARKRVCIATPRTDVVLELTPRLKAAFPEITVASLYGGSEDRHLYAPLTIATTHQLLRFYQAFDTVILDEVDAFPYTVEESLQYAAVQARKSTSCHDLPDCDTE